MSESYDFYTETKAEDKWNQDLPTLQFCFKTKKEFAAICSVSLCNLQKA